MGRRLQLVGGGQLCSQCRSTFFSRSPPLHYSSVLFSSSSATETWRELGAAKLKAVEAGPSARTINRIESPGADPPKRGVADAALLGHQVVTALRCKVDLCCRPAMCVVTVSPRVSRVSIRHATRCGCRQFREGCRERISWIHRDLCRGGSQWGSVDRIRQRELGNPHCDHLRRDAATHDDGRSTRWQKTPMGLAVTAESPNGILRVPSVGLISPAIRALSSVPCRRAGPNVP